MAASPLILHPFVSASPSQAWIQRTQGKHSLHLCHTSTQSEPGLALLQVQYSGDGSSLVSRGEDSSLCVYEAPQGYLPTKMLSAMPDACRVGGLVAPSSCMSWALLASQCLHRRLRTSTMTLTPCRATVDCMNATLSVHCNAGHAQSCACDAALGSQRSTL
jgi:hypothetical protein